MKNKRGFTLIEILIVVVVLVTVTAGATIGIKEIQKRSEERNLRELYTMIETAADTYLSINDEYREELLNDEITEKCIRIYTLQNGGLLKEELSNPVTKKRIPGNLCVISYINEDGLIENHFDLDDDLTTHKVTLKINGDGIADAETKTVYTKAIFNVIATSDKFIVNGVCDGGATIKIDNFKVIVYGVKKDQTCTVNIKNKQNKVTINTINGVSSPESVVVDYGKSASFKLTPNTGYQYDNYICTGANESSYSNNKLTIKNVTEPVTCTVTYNLKTYTLTVGGVNGTIGSPNNVTVNYGTTKEFTLTPNKGYKLNSATTTCKNATIDINNKKLIFTNINQDQSCKVIFKPEIYKISLDNQNATTPGTTEVYYEYNTTRTINKVKCYYYTDSSLKTCITSGTTLSKPSKTGYTFKGYYTDKNGKGKQYVNANGVFINNSYQTIENKTLYANWTINSYTLALKVVNGSGNASKTVNYNGNASFSNIKYSAGYMPLNAKVSCSGGASASISGTTVTVKNVTKAQTCIVTFAKETLSYRLLINNPTRLTRSDFGTAYTAANTGTLYTSTESIAGSTPTTVYYFAGNAQNNWVKFGTHKTTKVMYEGYAKTTDKDGSYHIDYNSLSECKKSSLSINNEFHKKCNKVTIYKAGDPIYWRIIRTNSDGSIRMVYAGNSTKSVDGYIEASNYNISHEDSLYTGYMYGDAGSLANNRKNTNSSTIKTEIDTWYKNNLNDYTNYLSNDAVYCNDRELMTYKPKDKYEYEYFPNKSYERLDANNKGRNASPTYNCANKKDAFSVNNKEAKLTYPIGMMTADEITFTGVVPFSGSIETSSPWIFLNSDNKHITNEAPWYTMTVYYGTAVWSAGRTSFPIGSLVFTGIGYDVIGIVRPVVSIKSCAIYKSGNGSANSPYEIALNGGC